jgi:hypothetical protein
MQDAHVPISRVLTYAAWIFTTLLLGAAWLSYWSNEHRLGEMLGYTACVGSAVAAVLHIRCFVLRAMALMRRLAERDASDRQGVHSVR